MQFIVAALAEAGQGQCVAIQKIVELAAASVVAALENVVAAASENRTWRSRRL